MLQRAIPSAALLLMLAACATTDDLRARTPIYSGKTQLGAANFVACVQERWINSGADRINYVPSDSHILLTSSGQTGVELLLDATGSPAGTTFQLYSRMALGEKKFISDTEACM
ncbi:hypothetical protein [Burkholderia gladioli]|uniref:hypothetical protein n=1 Tax=Burkholderia gladioli TaxID=28095 RepID=UPI0016406C46|nr:hypothetical protein [Burkholderia gladioli]